MKTMRYLMHHNENLATLFKISLPILLINICAILLLSSCMISAKYAPKPNPEIPKKWNAKNTNLNTNNCNTICIPWWKKFDDPVLNDLIQKGLQCNNDIHTAVANVEAAQGELKRVKYNWIPGLDSLLGYSSFPYLGYPGSIALLIPTYTINVFKQIKEQQNAKHELAVTKNMRDTVRLAVVAQIAGSYFQYQAQVERLILLKNIEADLSKKVNIYQATYHTGLTSDIELVRAKNKLEFIKSEEEIIGSLPFNIIENRPDMQKATNELKAANAKVGIAAYSFLPTIQLSAARGDIGIVPYSTTLGTNVYFNQALFQTSLIKLSLFGEFEKSHGVAKAYYAKYLDTFRKVLRDINNDLSANELYTERLDHTINAQNDLIKNYSLHSSLYNEGIISALKLLNEKIKLDEVKITLNEHKTEQLITIVNLYQDLAVGYGCT